MVLEMKRRNPYCGCRKLAEQLSSAFGLELNKDVVRRILLRHYSPRPRSGGRSWLAEIAHGLAPSWWTPREARKCARSE